MNKASREQLLEQLQKLASEDAELMEVIDFIREGCPAAGFSEEPRILMPYVNAPPLTECTWN